MVIQFTMFVGIWSRKISQSAMPRNRSSRRSRSAVIVGAIEIDRSRAAIFSGDRSRLGETSSDVSAEAARTAALGSPVFPSGLSARARFSLIVPDLGHGLLIWFALGRGLHVPSRHVRY